MSETKTYKGIIPFDMANALVLAVRRNNMTADELEVIYEWPASIIEDFFKDCLGTSITGVRNAKYWSLLLHRPVGEYLIKTKPTYDDLTIIYEQLTGGNTFPAWVQLELSDDEIILNGNPVDIDTYVTQDIGQQFMYVNVHHFYEGEDNQWRELALANMVEINPGRYDEAAKVDETNAWVDSYNADDSFIRTALNLI